MSEPKADFVTTLGSIEEAYVRGHWDGLRCDADTGFGILDECEHVGRIREPRAMSEPVTEAERLLLQWNFSGPPDVFLAELRAYRAEASVKALEWAKGRVQAMNGNGHDEPSEPALEAVIAMLDRAILAEREP